jgi:hypothetical protein
MAENLERVLYNRMKSLFNFDAFGYVIQVGVSKIIRGVPKRKQENSQPISGYYGLFLLFIAISWRKAID